jgi:hypothetical protein
MSTISRTTLRFVSAATALTIFRRDLAVLALLPDYPSEIFLRYSQLDQRRSVAFDLRDLDRFGVGYQSLYQEIG